MPSGPRISTRRPIAFLLVALVILPAACKRPLSQDELKGAALYRSNCAPCHEESHEGLLKTPPRLDGLFLRPNLPDGVPATDEAIHDVILQGLHTMPGFNGRLSEDQIHLILAYLHGRN